MANHPDQQHCEAVAGGDVEGAAEQEVGTGIGGDEDQGHGHDALEVCACVRWERRNGQ